MKLQEKILKNYRELYPNDKLKDISQKTKIHMSRIFRILNGQEMKISEYETFQSLIALNTIYKDENEFIHAAQKCSSKLSPERLNSLFIKMNMYLKNTNFNNTKRVNHSNLLQA
jgi:predicted transcriptional regulator